MQAAKDAINKITHKGGREDTSVHERVAPSVTQETVTRQQEDRVQTAVDKEVHQDHYHTSVQPVNDSEVLPEQHHHRMGETEHRTFDHNDDAKTQQRLQQEAGQFRDTQTRVEGGQTTNVQPTVAGEHVHHHVHETIQPVVNKQTIEPHVVHTTVPVHETHHNAAQHHATSALPAVSMDEFKNKGGSLTGRGERSDQFDGAPKTVGERGATGSSGLNSNSVGSNGNPSEWGNETRSGLNGASGTNTGAGVGGVSSGTSSSTTGKPSLMDKVNPKKDADGDGKAGFMK